jgi:hypothetical protein
VGRARKESEDMNSLRKGRERETFIDRSVLRVKSISRMRVGLLARASGKRMLAR